MLNTPLILIFTNVLGCVGFSIEISCSINSVLVTFKHNKKGCFSYVSYYVFTNVNIFSSKLKISAILICINLLNYYNSKFMQTIWVMAFLDRAAMIVEF